MVAEIDGGLRNIFAIRLVSAKVSKTVMWGFAGGRTKSRLSTELSFFRVIESAAN